MAVCAQAAGTAEGAFKKSKEDFNKFKSARNIGTFQQQAVLSQQVGKGHSWYGGLHVRSFATSAECDAEMILLEVGAWAKESDMADKNDAIVKTKRMEEEVGEAVCVVQRSKKMQNV